MKVPARPTYYIKLALILFTFSLLFKFDWIFGANDSLALTKKARNFWVFHVTIPQPDAKGSDGRLMDLLRIAQETENISYFGMFDEKISKPEHLEYYQSVIKGPVYGNSLDVENLLKAHIEQYGKCENALIFFFPTTDFWEWQIQVINEIRKQSYGCKVTILTDEIFWNRWKSIQSDPKVDMHEEFPWITSRWDLLQANMANYWKMGDNLAFISKRDGQEMLKFLPSRKSNVHLLPMVTETIQEYRSMPMLSGVMFMDFSVEHRMRLINFLEEVIPQMHESVESFHIVGGICRFLDLNVDFSESVASKVVLHGFLSEEDLCKLEEQITVAINPMETISGLSTKVIRAMKKGIPMVMAEQDAPEDFRGFPCKVTKPLCDPDNAKCFADFINTLHLDPVYWKALSNCQVDFIRSVYPVSAGKKRLGNVLSGVSLLSDFKSNGVYISMILANVAHKWELMKSSILQLIHLIQPREVFVSILSSNNRDQTKEKLEEFKRELDNIHVLSNIQIDNTMYEEEYKNNRPAYLGEQRNKTLKNLTMRFSHVLFLNDILFEARSVFKLLQSPIDYDMICAMDFGYSDFTLKNDKALWEDEKHLDFYDAWVARDIEGKLFDSKYPWLQHSRSAENVKNGKPVHVSSCWNGANVIKSSVILQGRVKFRGPQDHECVASECHLICKDMWRLGFKKIFVDPTVQVAYETDVFDKLQQSEYYKKFINESAVSSELFSLEDPKYDVCCIGDQKYEPKWENCEYAPYFNPKLVILEGRVISENADAYQIYDALELESKTVKGRLLSTVDDIPITDSDRPQGFFENIDFVQTAIPNLVISNDIDGYLLSEMKHKAILVDWTQCSFPDKWIEKLSIAQSVIYTWPKMKECLMKKGIDSSRLTFIPPSIDDSFLNPKEPEFKKESSFRFLVIDQSLETTLKVIEAFSDVSQDACLVILHSGRNRRKEFEEKVSSFDFCIELVSKDLITKNEIASYLSLANAYISVAEKDSIILGAMSLGIPVIALKTDSLFYLTESNSFQVEVDSMPCSEVDGKYCFNEKCYKFSSPPICEEANQESLTINIRKVKENVEERNKRASEAKKIVKYFHQKTIARVIEQMLSTTVLPGFRLVNPIASEENDFHPCPNALPAFFSNIKFPMNDLYKDVSVSDIKLYLYTSEYSNETVHVEFLNEFEMKVTARQACKENTECSRRLQNLVNVLQAIPKKKREFFVVLGAYNGKDLPVYCWKASRRLKRVILIPDPLLLSHDVKVISDKTDKAVYSGRVNAEAISLMNKENTDVCFDEPVDALEIILTIENQLYEHIRECDTSAYSVRYLFSGPKTSDSVDVLSTWKSNAICVFEKSNYQEYWEFFGQDGSTHVSSPDSSRETVDLEYSHSVSEILTDKCVLFSVYSRLFEIEQ